MLFHPTAVEIFFFLFLFATPPCSTRPPSSMLLICFDDPHTSTRTGGFWYVFYAIMLMHINCVFLDSISSLSLFTTSMTTTNCVRIYTTTSAQPLKYNSTQIAVLLYLAGSIYHQQTSRIAPSFPQRINVL